ncbi:RES family NAD+ phosphorylase [Bosea sp. F3-2]|uniref:RES family NAD+ phosphorylase n=1 Tax=Bosea sp. F3-2 TaxID=2599640 RepID=UPI0020C1891B|nr:RES family NAD+ phosphorylase [Bosea sp. F3-2]
MTWPKGQVIHRIHLDLYAPAAFNPGLRGNARFSPITDGNGAAIPTLYGGTSFDCAAMETVFHDVPFAPGLKTFDKAKLQGQVHSLLAPERDLILADLSAIALRSLGVQRKQLIDTEKDHYPQTRLWAEAIHAACPQIDGLCWISRQDDRASALVLFGNRIGAAELISSGSPRSLLGEQDLYDDVLTLAERIGVNLISSRR